MLQPKRQKYRKQFRGTMKGMAQSGNTLCFADFGLKAVSQGWITAQQIESARKTIAHYTQRAGKVWVRVFPDKPKTQKGQGVGMGGGKGEVVGFVVPVNPGRILFEMAGVPEEIARQAFQRAAAKLPLVTKLVKKT
jgi:large subunit ribosomal protein L16